MPQGRHVHVLLPRGLRILEAYFPGLIDGFLEAGALRIDVGRDIAWRYGGGWRTRYDSELDLVAASRPLFEAHVSERVRALPNATIREGVRVEAPGVENGSVTEASIRDGQGQEAIATDLLVDATGRGSPMPRWLEHLGYASPRTAPSRRRLPMRPACFRGPMPCRTGARWW